MSPGDTAASTEDVLGAEFILRLYVDFFFFFPETPHLKNSTLVLLVWIPSRCKRYSLKPSCSRERGSSAVELLLCTEQYKHGAAGTCFAKDWWGRHVAPLLARTLVPLKRHQRVKDSQLQFNGSSRGPGKQTHKKRLRPYCIALVFEWPQRHCSEHAGEGVPWVSKAHLLPPLQGRK